MEIRSNISLKKFNTFGIDVNAKRFVEITSIHDLKELLNLEKDFFILGGGSNILLTKDLDTLVVHVNLSGIDIIDETKNHVFVKVGAGENWHKLVLWSIDKDYGGIENLSLIPGNVGTAPIQNIGAYGVEIKDTFQELEATEILTGISKIFTKTTCEFGYRNSVFKKNLKGKHIITNVTLKLTKHKHKLNSSYGAIRSELEKQDIKSPSIKDISNAVIGIRQSKLPDPEELGNSGSFFKNPEISNQDFEKLQLQFPEVPYYTVSDEVIKVPAGWLVEQCGFKGRRFGDAGVHKKQALVLVNYGTATGVEIFELSKKIQKAVLEKFDIELEAEVNII